jgi:hypothetical protein
VRYSVKWEHKLNEDSSISGDSQLVGSIGNVALVIRETSEAQGQC